MTLAAGSFPSLVLLRLLLAPTPRSVDSLKSDSDLLPVLQDADRVTAGQRDNRAREILDRAQRQLETKKGSENTKSSEPSH